MHITLGPSYNGMYQSPHSTQVDGIRHLGSTPLLDFSFYSYDILHYAPYLAPSHNLLSTFFPFLPLTKLHKCTWINSGVSHHVLVTTRKSKYLFHIVNLEMLMKCYAHGIPLRKEYNFNPCKIPFFV